MKNSISLLFLALFLFSCEKEELPILAHQSGDATENQVGMQQDYRNQLFFDLA